MTKEKKFILRSDDAKDIYEGESVYMLELDYNKPQCRLSSFTAQEPFKRSCGTLYYKDINNATKDAQKHILEYELLFLLSDVEVAISNFYILFNNEKEIHEASPIDLAAFLIKELKTKMTTKQKEIG